MMKLAALAIFVCSALLSPAFAAGEGTAVGVNPDAMSRLGIDEKVLVVGADVSVGEKIITGPTGHVQLLFDDQTRLVVGPRSTLEIETYLLNGSGADKFAINALAGTFRFISGTSPKSAYSIDTPTASIAVRGTKFDLTVASRQTLAMLYEGALTLCEDGICVDLTARCDIGAVGGGNAGAFGWADGRRDGLVGNFPLANIQSAFRTGFRVAGAQACHAPSTSGAATSILDTVPSGPTQNPNQVQNQTPNPNCPPFATTC